MSFDGPEPADYSPLAEANREAARLQREAADQAIKSWEAHNKQTRADFKPYREYGLRVMAELEEGRKSGRFKMPEWMEPEKFEAPEFEAPEFKAIEWDPDSFVFEKDPGYQFRLDEGLKAIRRGASASGMRGSGATLKALQNYGQDYASQEYDKSYNRAIGDWQRQRQANLDQYGADFQNALTGYNANFQGDLTEYNTGRQDALDAYNAKSNAVRFDYNQLAGGINVGLQATGQTAGHAAQAVQGQNQANIFGAQEVGAGNIGYQNALIAGQNAQIASHQQGLNNLFSAAGLGIGFFGAGQPGMEW